MVEEATEVTPPSTDNPPSSENGVEGSAAPAAAEPSAEVKEPDANTSSTVEASGDASKNEKNHSIPETSVIAEESTAEVSDSKGQPEVPQESVPAGEAAAPDKPEGEADSDSAGKEVEGNAGNAGPVKNEGSFDPLIVPEAEDETVDITDDGDVPLSGSGDADGKTFMEEMHEALLPEGLTPEIQAEITAQGNNATPDTGAEANAGLSSDHPGEEDATVDIDGPEGMEVTTGPENHVLAVNENVADEEGQETGDVDILGEDADGEGGAIQAATSVANGEPAVGGEAAGKGQQGQEAYGDQEEIPFGAPAGMDADEEEEDIDIVEVDEEEEAMVKQAMGVGEGMPLGDDEYGQEGEEGMLEAGQEGGYSNGDGLVEGEAGLEQALAEAEAAAGVAAGLANAGETDAVLDATVKGKRAARGKRKIVGHEGDEEEAEADILGPGDLEAARRTRQRTARPPPQKRKRMQKMEEEQQQLVAEDEEHQMTHDLELDVDQLQEATAGGPGEPPAAAAKLRRGRTASTASLLQAKMASVAGSPGTSPLPRTPKSAKKDEPLVKFAIKSFTVPELVVALPESSTVGQLKKAVMDAAMKLLGGGLRVRVLLQGKRLQEEATSLAQAGISRSTLGTGKVSDALAFMLEPTPLYSVNPNDNDPLLVLSQAAGSPSPRPAYGMPSGSQTTGLRSSSLRNKMNRGKGKVADDDADYDVNEDVYEARIRSARAGKGGRGAPSPHTTRVAAAQALAAIRAQAEANQRGIKMEGEGVGPSDQLDSNSGALVLHPSVMDHGMVQGHHSMALVQHKARSATLGMMGLEGRRRIRRPFTVHEVHSLVEAVEKLGTGRWRDVKSYGFGQSKHRTYVDLKDKWKTLVHTAQIAPHQRRGEPVPPELLERVTKAHAYWTAQLRAQQDDRDA